MTVEQAENQITSQLADRLDADGFKKKSRFLITRATDKAIEQLRCGVRKDQFSGKFLVSLMAGLRFGEVEAILARTDDLNSATLVVPIHLLHKDGKYTEWDVEAPQTASELFTEVQLYALPFFEKWSSLDVVILSLQSENPRDRVAKTAASRIETLSAILALKGQKNEALSLLDEAIEKEREKPVIGKRLRLEKLRDRLANGNC
jgi:hypothetical protein